MNEFKILDNPQQCSYFKEFKYDSHDDEYFNRPYVFAGYTKKSFLEELKKHGTIKRQAGCSKLKECDYISLILVKENSGDGEFTGHSINSTCIVYKNNAYNDSNYEDNEDLYGEISSVVSTIYHVLPDGKLIEYAIEKTYTKELEKIYTNINKIRQYYLLSQALDSKNTTQKRTKI